MKNKLSQSTSSIKKNRKSTSGEFFSSRTRLNLGQVDVSHMSVAHLEQIRHAHGDFWKNDCINKKKFDSCW